jgi:hypothetical protein
MPEAAIDEYGEFGSREYHIGSSSFTEQGHISAIPKSEGMEGRTKRYLAGRVATPRHLHAMTNDRGRSGRSVEIAPHIRGLGAVRHDAETREVQRLTPLLRTPCVLRAASRLPGNHPQSGAR